MLNIFNEIFFSPLQFQFRVPLSSVVSKGPIYNVAEVVKGKTFSPTNYDCFFRIDDRLIGAHRELLSKLSPVFSVMFSVEWNSPQEIPIIDTTYDTFATFMEFFYFGRVRISVDNVTDVLYLAHIYDVQPIIPHCIEMIVQMLCVETVVEMLEFATYLDLVELTQSCADFIRAHTEETLWYEVNRSCKLSTLQTILEVVADHRSCTERTVLNVCLVWAAAVCRQKNINDMNGQNLRSELGECFGLLRFKQLKSREFWSVYSGPIGDMFSKKEADHILEHFMTNQTP